MPPEGRVTHFGLIRHLPTVWNLENRIQGQMDSALAPEGKCLGKKWGRRLGEHAWDAILASDLGRALKTAELINAVLDVPLVSTRLLREVDWGRWAGRSLKELQEKYPGLLPAMEKAGWEFRPPGGEDRNEVWERAHCALKRAARKWPERTVLVVAHEGVLQCLVQRLCKRRFLPDEPPLLKSGYLQRLAYGGEGLKIEKLNAVALPD